MDYKIGFLGYGNMARAVSAGLNNSELVPYAHQMISGRDKVRLTEVAKSRPVAIANDNCELVRSCQTIVLGVKPHQVKAVLGEIKNELTQTHLVISMAAGVNLSLLQSWLPPHCSLVRSMPNVGVLVGQGVTLLCAPLSCSTDHLKRTQDMFASVGLALELEEKLFEVATVLSGSGPAYIFTILESLVRGTVRLGLPWEVARLLAVETARGAIEISRTQPNQHLSELRDMVTSPGGITAEALLVMEKKGLGGILQEALEAAAIKGKNML